MTASAAPDVRVSVCIPGYTSGDYFEQALRSAVAQSERNLEIIVTDDSGGTLEPAVMALADPRIRYIANPAPLGFAANHSKAISEARGGAVAILHDDDLWQPDYLERALTELERHPAVGVVITGVRDIGPDGEDWGPRPQRDLTEGVLTDPMASYLAKDFALMLPSNTVYRRTALADAGLPWPDLTCADVGMYLDLTSAGWHTYLVADELVRYRSHANQLSVRLLPQRDSVVKLFDRYRFTDGRVERLRRSRVAQALVARAGAYARLQNGRATRRDLRQAAALDRSAVRARWVGLYGLSLAPRALPALHRAWTRYLHDPVTTRHQG